MNGTRAVAGLLALGAVAAVSAVLLPGQPLHPDPGTPCPAVAGLDEAMDLTTVGDQVVVRARAAALADALAHRAAGDDPGRGDALRVQDLLDLLEDPGATVAELVDVVEPLAEDCGITLQAAPPGQ